MLPSKDDCLCFVLGHGDPDEPITWSVDFPVPSENRGGSIFSNPSSSASPSDISNIKSATELLPFSCGVSAGLFASIFAWLDARLRLRCRSGEAETSSKLCALKEVDGISPLAYLLERTMASIFARLPRSILSASSGYCSKRSASARPLLAKGR